MILRYSGSSPVLLGIRPIPYKFLADVTEHDVEVLETALLVVLEAPLLVRGDEDVVGFFGAVPVFSECLVQHLVLRNVPFQRLHWHAQVSLGLSAFASKPLLSSFQENLGNVEVLRDSPMHFLTAGPG